MIGQRRLVVVNSMKRISLTFPVFFFFFLVGVTENRVNQQGRRFRSGEALPIYVRQKIIELAGTGIRPCEISRQLRVSHGCISKLLAKYNRTGSFEPGSSHTLRNVSREVREKIEDYRRLNPGIFSWEVQEKLLAEGVCLRRTLPPLPLISRIAMGKSKEIPGFFDHTTNFPPWQMERKLEPSTRGNGWVR